jgi:hypothetical protein
MMDADARSRGSPTRTPRFVSILSVHVPTCIKIPLTEDEGPRIWGNIACQAGAREFLFSLSLKRRVKWDNKYLSRDGAGLTHRLAWSAAGGTWQYPRPYQVCPWNSDETEYPEHQWEVLFPSTFVLRLRRHMREPDRVRFNVHTAGYYNAIWMGMRNYIKRDPALLGDPKIQDYVKKVIKGTQRCRDIGQFEDHDEHDINDLNSFRMTGHLEDSMSTTMVKRGGSNQPQAIGSQKKSKVGSSITPSPQEQKKVFDPKTAIDAADEPEYAASSSSVGSRRRATRRGRGPPKAKAEAQTTQTDRPNESPTTSTTRTRATTPQRVIVSMLPCRDVRETERKRQEETARAQRTGGRPIAPDNAMDDTTVEAAGAGRGQTLSEQDREERRHTPWRYARQEGRHRGPYSSTQGTYAPRPLLGRGCSTSTNPTPSAPWCDHGDYTGERILIANAGDCSG